MISKFSKSVIILRTYIMKYILLSGYDTWDKKTSQFREPIIYQQWNATLLLYSLGIYPILLTIHLVNKAMSETIFDINNPGKFISYVIGWAENAIGVLIVILGVWCKTKSELATTIQNQLFSYNEAMSRIHRQNGHRPSYVNTCDRIMIATFITTLILPFSFVAVLTLDADETHNLIMDWLEIDLKWTSYPLLIIGICRGASNAASICFFAVALAALYMFPLIVNLTYLRPISVSIDRAETIINPDGNIHFLITTQGFGMLTEDEYMKMIRTEGVMCKMFGDLYRSVWISSHHVTLLVFFVATIFIAIKIADNLVKEGILIIIVLLASLLVPIMLEYTEGTRVGQMVDASSMLLKSTKKLCMRKTALFKFVASCQTIRLELGYPFFKVQRQSFLDFMHQAANLLFTLLAS